MDEYETEPPLKIFGERKRWLLPPNWNGIGGATFVVGS